MKSNPVKGGRPSREVMTRSMNRSEVMTRSVSSGPTGCLPCTDFTGDGICDPNPFGINEPMPHEGVDAFGVVGIPQY